MPLYAPPGARWRNLYSKINVEVGMPVTRHPPHRSGLESLPHPALTSSFWRQNRFFFDVHHQGQTTQRSDPEFGLWCSSWCFSWSTPFATISKGSAGATCSLCSPASLVLCCCPTPVKHCEVSVRIYSFPTPPGIVALVSCSKRSGLPSILHQFCIFVICIL
jgi:hypothetical protein